VQVTFTTLERPYERETCPPVILNGQKILQADEIKYLGIHLDRRLNWKKQILTKCEQLGQLEKMYWLFGRKSQLITENKLLLAILKLIWAYGIQLWSTASNSNIEILQKFQNKILRIIVDAP